MKKDIPTQPKKPAAEKRKQVGTDQEREMYRAWKMQDIKARHPEMTEAQIGKVKMPAWKSYSNMLEDCIKAWAAANGHMATKIDVRGQYRGGKYTYTKATKGVEDIQLIMGGRLVAVEVKVGKDRMSAEQMKRQHDYNARGIKYIVVHTVADFLLKIENF